MKAAVIKTAGGPENIIIEERPVPTPTEGRVLVKVKAFGLNRSELMTRKGLSPGVKIISAEIRWKDDHPANIVPRPGSIPLAWKVVFDDELMRQQPGSVPAVAWIDAQTGTMLAFNYRN